MLQSGRRPTAYFRDAGSVSIRFRHIAGRIAVVRVALRTEDIVISLLPGHRPEGDSNANDQHENDRAANAAKDANVRRFAVGATHEKAPGLNKPGWAFLCHRSCTLLQRSIR